MRDDGEHLYGLPGLAPKDEAKVLDYVQKHPRSTYKKVDKKQDAEELNEFREYLREKQRAFYSDFHASEHAQDGHDAKLKKMDKKKKEVVAEMKQLQIVNINKVDSSSEDD